MVEFVNGEIEEVKGNGFGKEKVWDIEGLRNWAYSLLEEAKKHNATKIVITQNDIEEVFSKFYKRDGDLPKTAKSIQGKRSRIVFRLKHIIFRDEPRVKTVRSSRRMTANGPEYVIIIELNDSATNAPTTKTETPETPKKSLEEVMAENQKKIEEMTLEEELDDIEIEIPSN